MGYGSGQLNVTHSLTSYLLGGNVHTALLTTDDFLAVRILIFAAHTSAVLGRTKDTLAEQTAYFRFKSSVVDSLGLINLAVRPFSDHFRRCQTNLD